MFMYTKNLSYRKQSLLNVYSNFVLHPNMSNLVIHNNSQISQGNWLNRSIIYLNPITTTTKHSFD